MRPPPPHYLSDPVHAAILPFSGFSPEMQNEVSVSGVASATPAAVSGSGNTTAQEPEVEEG